MATNKYWNNQSPEVTNEQQLIAGMMQEVIQINGMDVYYILRDSQSSLDYILGEDPTSMFQRAYLIEMYLDNPGGSVSGGDLLSKFGLNITDSSNFVVSQKAFDRYIPKQFRSHPIEGDLIYVPIMNQTFEIKKVEEEQNFYSLGKRDPYFFNLKTATFQFSQESFQTGIDELDSIQSDSAYLISLPVAPGTGSFMRGETIYQGGANVATATATAKVDEWFSANNTLHVYYIKGEFDQNTNITGDTSGITRYLQYYDDRKNVSRYDDYQNNYFEEEANNIIDLSVNNPAFGNPSQDIE